MPEHSLNGERIEESLRRDRTLRRIFCLFAALACGAIFFYVGVRVLRAVHPGEDAYILYRYAEHLATGQGIVFNSGGPRAEGATDFLWLLLLAGGVRLGGDVALVALAFNAFGAGLAGWLLARCCWGEPDRPLWVRVLLGAAVPSVFLTGGALAGYWGFSSMLNSALILALFVLALDARGRMTLAIPILGLIIALVRPDGVIVGAGFFVLGLWTAWSEKRVRNYVAVSGACAVTGVIYFIWRWNYFGLLLPLPLYVKQNAARSEASNLGSLLPGLESHWTWFDDSTGPFLIVLGLAATLMYARFWRDRNLIRILVFLLPGAALLAMLALAVPTQNIRWRFQAPVYLLLLYSLLYVAGRIIDTRRTTISSLLMAGVVIFAATPPNWAGLRVIRKHQSGAWGTYLEALAPRIGPRMDAHTVIALTEAGGLPYWTKANIADIVGLNYPEAAVRPPSVETLKAIDPDMVFLHQGTSLDNDLLIPADAEDARVYEITPERLGKAFRPSRREIVERVPTSYRDVGLMNVQYAPSVMIKFLSESPNYDIYVVDMERNHTFLHVYGLKKSWPLKEEVRAALDSSFLPGNYRSYLALRALEKTAESK